MSQKSEQMESVIKDLRNNTAVEEILVKRKGKPVNVGLVNHFRKHEIIPNKWFDWTNRVDSRIMVIGQDWGPYVALQKYVVDYENLRNEPGFDYNSFLFKAFSSRTEKFIMNIVQNTYREKYNKFSMQVWDNFIFTMAVLYTRQGTHFRGNEFFDEKQSTELCYPYVVRQIEIIKPQVIITLGNLGFQVVNKYYSLQKRKDKLTEVIEELAHSNNKIVVDGVEIIPNFHPAAHIPPEISIKIWKRIWDTFD